MIRKKNPNQQYLEEFKMQFGGKLRKDNRWIKKSEMIPWEIIEDEYSKKFSNECGAYALSGRIAFGALFIQSLTGLTDREVVKHISENAYMQYFLGLSEFTDEPLFDASMMTHFRKRFSADFINRINEAMFEPESEKLLDENNPNDKDNNKPDPPSASSNSNIETKTTENKGKLIMDATVAPADIRYPSDISILNESRENLEQMIEELWLRGDRKGHKTDYSRKKARKEYLTIAKQKKPRIAKIRRTIKQQLEYIKKDIDTIGRLMMQAGAETLPEKRIARLMTICEVHRQQYRMSKSKNHSCENRIVSLRQPHVRPIVRGKAGKPYEFGQKISAAVVEGYTFLDRQSYDNFNESTRLVEITERYKTRYGYYPEAVLADKIYRNRTNLSYCKEHGIRLSGPKLGRPKKNPDKAEKRYMARDNAERNIIEGRFGVVKRRFGFGLIMAYLPETGLTEAAMKVLCMNVMIKIKRDIKIFFNFLKRRFIIVFSAIFVFLLGK